MSIETTGSQFEALMEIAEGEVYWLFIEYLKLSGQCQACKLPPENIVDLFTKEIVPDERYPRTPIHHFSVLGLCREHTERFQKLSYRKFCLKYHDPFRVERDRHRIWPTVPRMTDGLALESLNMAVNLSVHFFVRDLFLVLCESNNVTETSQLGIVRKLVRSMPNRILATHLDDRPDEE